VEGLLPRRLYSYDISLERVLDLTDSTVRTTVSVGLDLLTSPDWHLCQELGATAHALGLQPILSPSATTVDHVLAVFIQHLGLGTLEPAPAEDWHSVDDLDG
jgi:RES domain-containing protein